MTGILAPAAAPIVFCDLAAQQARIRDRVDRAIARVLSHGHYVMGPEVEELECRLAAFAGVRHAVTCASGTDALALALVALGLRAGEAVLVPSFTFAATAEVVPWLGAVPIFVDVLEGTFNMDPASLERGVAVARRLGLRPAGVIAVDLFGQPADYAALAAVAAAHGLWLLADAAQSFGAVYRGRRVGQLGAVAATSFFPAKPLGCYGDGGAAFTDNDDLASAMRSLRVHGQGSGKYDNVRVGTNARLDTLQAAILLEKLAVFEDELAAREAIAVRYEAGLAGAVAVPRVPEGSSSAWAQYTVRAADRDGLAAALKVVGVPTAVYYPTPLHRQPAYRGYPTAGEGLPVAEHLAREVLSLPMHPYLTAEAQQRAVAAVRAAVRADSR